MSETGTDKPKPEPKRFVATVREPVFEAIQAGLFRFATLPQAVSKLNHIGQRYIIAKEQDPISPTEPPTLRIWIRGFMLAEEETKQGYRGHFARLSVARLPSGKFTITAEKLDIPLAQHPQKQRQKRHLPDFGHPILRNAEKGKLYKTVEDARAALLFLHEQYPETSIPGIDKLNLMVYSKKHVPPVQKMTLRVAVVADQGFKLELQDNARKPLPGAAKPVSEKEPPQGKYTSLVSLQRKRKKK